MEIPQFTLVFPSIAPLVGNFIPMVGYYALKPHGRPMLRLSPLPINLLALDFPGVTAFVSKLGWPKYRARQILRWVYQSRIRDIHQMTDLALQDREYLQSFVTIGRGSKPRVLQSGDGTRKFILPLEDGGTIESVLIPEGRRVTLCVSTQVGCTLDCTFCLTGQMGLKRNLKAHEIVEQVLTAQDHLSPSGHITSLVFMGMGEPLANLDEVSDAIHRLTNTQWGPGFSPRRITISTAGLATRLHETAGLGVNLAISLNATTNEQRGRLMPRVNQLHPLPELLDACRTYPLSRGRRLTFEYVLLGGENDSATDAKRLAKLLKGIRCKINLIPFNEFPGNPFRRPDEAVVIQFQSLLRQSHFDVFIRKSRGRDILGACGQLGDLPL